MKDRVLVAPDFAIAVNFAKRLGIEKHNTIADDPINLKKVDETCNITVIDYDELSEPTKTILSRYIEQGRSVSFMNR